MKNTSVKSLLLILALSSSLFVSAQKSTVTVGNGAGKNTEVDISALKHITIKDVDHDDKPHEYSGVLLSDVLAKGGIILGDANRKPNAGNYILVKAKDNYQVVYAVAEIDPIYTDKTIILADKIDGKTLLLADGPYEIIVPGEKVHARWIKQIVSMELVTPK